MWDSQSSDLLDKFTCKDEVYNLLRSEDQYKVLVQAKKV